MYNKIIIALSTLTLLCSLGCKTHYEGTIVEYHYSNYSSQEYIILECDDGYRRQIWGGVYGKVGEHVKISR